MEIKAILFDSGRVLNEPATGHWFIPPKFSEFVNEQKYKDIDKKVLNLAFHTASAYISEQKWIKNEDEEYAHFLGFYRIFAAELPQLGLTDEIVNSLASDLVYNYEKYKFFPDAVELIPELSKTYKLAVVSDAWPSLEHVFKQAGLRDYFSSFVISSVIGVTKPHELMYKTALEELNLSPSEVVFIDDNVRNCDGAHELGIRSFLLCRDWKHYMYSKITCRKHTAVRDLYDVIKNLRR
ncbi:HAD-IA family hydrolase [Paenibacillus puldeungensis]|uniref:HAD-IA family hydrolase n=1 Tax=Paenibacillus puldeungensis TaxID=696536 RepID=A0ABW3RZR4_9BACL